jgi:tetratricopeptide (TPR) repeat protein
VGAVLGVSALVRPNVLLFLPLLAVWLFLRARALEARPLLAAAALTAGTLLPILPITLYNAIAGRDLVLIASQAGVNLWIGNNPASDGSTALVPGTREDWWGGYRDAIAQAERAEGRKLRPSEVSQHFAGRAYEFARSQPLAWLQLLLHKARLFTWNAELGNNEEPRFLFERFSPLAPLARFGFAWIFALGCVGLAVTWRAAWLRLPLWGFLLTYSASVVVYFVNSRFRLPILPVLAIFTGGALVWMAEAARSRRWAGVVASLGAALSLALFSLAVPESAERRSQSNGHLMLGAAAARAGNWEEAATELRRAVELEPQSSQAWRTLGLVLRSGSDLRGAEQALRRALEVRADDADALDALADLLLEQRRWSDALGQASVLARIEPGSARGPYAEGRAWFGAGDPERGRAALEQALQRDPEHFGSAYALGRCLLELGQAALAAQAFERAVSAPWLPEQRPFALDAWLRGVEGWRNLGELDRARALFGRGLAEFGGEAAAGELRRLLGL